MFTYQKQPCWITLRPVLPNESLEVLLFTKWKGHSPSLETFAGLHYHSVQLSPGVCRSLQDILMVMTRWKMSFAINKKLALLTFQFFSTTVTNLLSTKFKCPKMITNTLQCDYFHGSESMQCHKLTLFWYAQDHLELNLWYG